MTPRIYDEENKYYKEPVIMIKADSIDILPNKTDDSVKTIIPEECTILSLNNIKIVTTGVKQEVCKIIYFDIYNTKYIEHIPIPKIENKKLFEELKNTFNSIVSMTFSEYSPAYCKYCFSDIIMLKLFLYYTLKLQDKGYFISADYSSSSFIYVGNTDPMELLSDFYNIINRDFILTITKQNEKEFKVNLETHYNNYTNILNIDDEERKEFVETYFIWDYLRKKLLDKMKNSFDPELLI